MILCFEDVKSRRFYENDEKIYFNKTMEIYANSSCPKNVMYNKSYILSLSIENECKMLHMRLSTSFLIHWFCIEKFWLEIWSYTTREDEDTDEQKKMEILSVCSFDNNVHFFGRSVEIGMIFEWTNDKTDGRRIRQMDKLMSVDSLKCSRICLKSTKSFLSNWKD